MRLFHRAHASTRPDKWYEGEWLRATNFRISYSGPEQGCAVTCGLEWLRAEAGGAGPL